MKLVRHLITSSLLLLLECSAWTTAEPAERSWNLYHTVIGKDTVEPVFEERGVVRLTLKDPNSEAPESKKKPAVLKAKESPFHVELKQAAVASDFKFQDGSFYQLKLISQQDEQASPILTTVPACDVRRANFRDEFVITLGAQAQAISLAYIPLVSPLAPKSCEAYENANFTAPVEFASQLFAETSVPAMTLKTVLPEYQPPPGWKVLKGASDHAKNFVMPEDGTTTNDDPHKQPDSMLWGFIKKYWYILLPLFLMNFISADPPAAEGETAAAAGAATSAVAGAAAPAATSKQRRGKRG